MQTWNKLIPCWFRLCRCCSFSAFVCRLDGLAMITPRALSLRLCMYVTRYAVECRTFRLASFKGRREVWKSHTQTTLYTIKQMHSRAAEWKSAQAKRNTGSNTGKWYVSFAKMRPTKRPPERWKKLRGTEARDGWFSWTIIFPRTMKLLEKALQRRLEQDRWIGRQTDAAG